MRIRSVLNHTGQVVAEGALIALLVVGLVAGTALAGKGGTGKPAPTGGTLTVLDGTYGSTTVASAGSAYVWVHAKCSQAGTLVYEQWVKTDASGRGTLTLGPTPMWNSGAADCWAESGTWTNSRWRQAATTTFRVAA